MHERAAAWSPDGKWIAYLSDATGEFELYLRPQNSRSPATPADAEQRHLSLLARLVRPRFQETPLGRPQASACASSRSRPRPSPPPSTKTPNAPITQYDSAPDSQWVTWIRQERGSLRVMLHGLADKQTLTVDDGWYAPSQPAFSDDGEGLLVAVGRAALPRPRSWRMR